MIYRKITLWTRGAETWIAFDAENGRDMAMCVLRPREVAKTVAWAKSHNLSIEDNR